MTEHRSYQAKKNWWVHFGWLSLLVIAVLLFALLSVRRGAGLRFARNEKKLVVYCAAGMRLPVQQAAESYTEKYDQPIRFDSRGRVWKSTIHKIDDADGSDDDTLDTLNWYGRLSTTSSSSYYDERLVSTTVHTGTLATEVVTITEPAVITSENGAGTTDKWKQYFNKDGTKGFEKSLDDIITYWEYTTGQLTRNIRDAHTGHSDFSGITIPTGFSSSGNGILHHVTDYEFDDQGRLEETELPDGRPMRRY